MPNETFDPRLTRVFVVRPDADGNYEVVTRFDEEYRGATGHVEVVANPDTTHGAPNMQAALRALATYFSRYKGEAVNG